MPLTLFRIYKWQMMVSTRKMTTPTAMDAVTVMVGIVSTTFVVVVVPPCVPEETERIKLCSTLYAT